jgi:hypothetical protein
MEDGLSLGIGESIEDACIWGVRRVVGVGHEVRDVVDGDLSRHL